jgi:hypothetical protein
MINHHIHAALATERRDALLAEAEAARRANRARLHRQRMHTPVARRPPLRWLLEAVAGRPAPSAIPAARPAAIEGQP